MNVNRKALPVSALSILPAILYAPFLFGGKVLYWGVYLLQFYPWRQLAVEQIRAGHWPLWNPYLGAGTPLAANLQTAAFYPPNVLFLLMPVERALGWALALHVALAGLSAYYLARTLDLSRFGALVTGLTYGLGGYVVAHWVFPSMVYAAAWLPLMLALAERLVSNIQYPISKAKRYWILDIGLLASAIALQLLAGHAQTSFYSLLIVAAFQISSFKFQVLSFKGQAARDKLQLVTRHWLLATCYLLLATLWGAALAAIQLLPTAELAAHSQRAGTLTDLEFAYGLSFWPWRLITLLAPDFFGNPAHSNGSGGYWAHGTYWEEAAFVGVLPLLLAGLAVVAWWRKRRSADKGPLALVPFLIVLALASVTLALGKHTPIYPLLFRYVPGFGLFQAPARLIVGYALALPLLAGIGADAFRPTPRGRTALRVLLVVGLGAGIAGAAARWGMPSVRNSFGESILRLGLTLALAAALLLLRGRRLSAGRRQALVATFVALDLLAFGWGLAPGAEPTVYHSPVATAEFLKGQPPGRVLVDPAYADAVYDEYVSLDAFGPADPAFLQGLRESLHPNLSAVHHLAAIGNYDPLTVGLYRDLWDEIEGSSNKLQVASKERSLSSLFGVRYVVSDDEWDLPLIYNTGPFVSVNESALPQAWLVPRARVVKEAEARLAILANPAFEPRAEVLLSHAPASPPPEGDGGAPPGEPSILREGPDRVIIQADAGQGGYLVLADTYYPGWQATVDGQPAEILPANHAFRAVPLAAGPHTVVFEYRPRSFQAGAWITLAAALLLVVALGTGTWTSRKLAR